VACLPRSAEAIQAVDDWMQRYRTFWEGSLSRLEKILNAPEETPDHE